MDKLYKKSFKDEKKNVRISCVEVLAIKIIDNLENLTLSDLDAYKDPELIATMKNEMKRRMIVSIKYILRDLSVSNRKKVFKSAKIRLKKGETISRFIKSLDNKSYKEVQKIKNGLNTA